MNRGPAQLRSVHGFTLVEVTIILLLTALLATLVVVSLQAPLRSARLIDAADVVRRWDALARATSARSGVPLRLVFGIGSSTLERSDGAKTKLPSLFHIDQVRDNGHTSDDGGVDPRRSYAVRLVDAAGAQATWVVIAGPTGEAVQTSDDAEIAGIFGNDAH